MSDRIGATRMTLPPAAAPDALAADETALFCIGAHMSGLPLNHQLTDTRRPFPARGATAPRYRLHALGNRPGMLRADDGAAIEGEVWALPTAAIGALLAQVPPAAWFRHRAAGATAPVWASWPRPTASRRRATSPIRRLACLAGRHAGRHERHDELDAWLDANAALLGIAVAPEWRDAIRLHLRITRDLGRSA